MASESDPRVYFAAERTLLAWVRTGLATIGLGFVVARFGLFLRMLRNGPDAPSHVGSTLIGVGLVLLGSAAMALAAWNHLAFCRTLGPHERPARMSLGWPIAFSVVTAAIGAVLAIYLLVRSNVG
jgi:putative membrane protein